MSSSNVQFICYSAMKIANFHQPLPLLIFLISSTLSPFVSSQNIYTGSVSFIQFNDDGSFLFQLNNEKKVITVNNPDCRIKKLFIVEKDRRNVKYEEVVRMRNDIREIFLTNRDNIQISVSVYSCNAAGYPIVDNIMFGEQIK